MRMCLNICVSQIFLQALLFVGCVSGPDCDITTDSLSPHGRLTTTDVIPSDASALLEVNGRYYLTDTQLDVQDGDSVTIAAEGEVCWECSGLCFENCDRCADPDGSDIAWGLWARIGTKQPFRVGSDTTVDIENSGRLYMVIPEQENVSEYYEEYYIDNWGSYTVQINVLNPI
ncbi:MAG: hypothetical protein ABIK83_14130 [Candidatus Zixiibacteriota bacterium]